VKLREAPILRGRAPSMRQLADVVQSEFADQVALRARDLVGFDDVQQMLDTLGERAPALARSVVPKPMSLAQLCEVLRQLLDEGVSVQAFERIAESLASATERDLTVDRAVDLVRQALKDELTQKLVREGCLSLHRVDPLIEDAVREATHMVHGRSVVGLQPDLASDIIESVRKARTQHGGQPVLLTQPDVRRGLRDVLAAELPDVTVLSYAELPVDLVVDQREPIGV
jgi:flagellar biosynthesis component FlhA